LVPPASAGAAALFTLVFAVRSVSGPGAVPPIRDAIPGGVLHPLKLAGEQAHLSWLELTSGDEWCALYERQIAAERVREIETLITAGARQAVQFEGYVDPAPGTDGASPGTVAGIPVMWHLGEQPPTAGSYVRVLGVLEDRIVRVERAEPVAPP
jgi:hypothetical protein